MKTRISPLLVLLTAIAGGTLLLGPSARAEAWSPESDPFRLSSDYVYSFAALPLSAELPDRLKPWSGSFWPSRDGGIAYRWRSRRKPWQYATPSMDRIASMSSDELAALSPAEKLDLVRGETAFPTVSLLLHRANGGEAPSWEGICNGWSQASAQLEEPVDTVIRSHGLEIPFSSADLKAIAAWYYEDEKGGKPDHDATTRRLGVRCGDDASRTDCRRDLNPGALHVAVANQIARSQEAIYADLSRGPQIWQHPIYGYEARVLGERSPRPGAAPGTEREVHVRLELRMADYASPSAPTGVLRTKSRVLRYWLELDRDGTILGGRWSDLFSGAPDYLWVSDTIPIAHGYEPFADALKIRGF